MYRSHRTTWAVGRAPSGPGRPRRTLVAAALLWATALGGVTGGVTASATVAGAATPAGPSETLTLPRALHHGYRHGAVPRRTRDVRGVQALLAGAPTSPSSAAAAKVGGKDLLYGGGLTAGGLVAAGVTTGQPLVYLVFMGGQWGTASTDSSGHTLLSGDPAAMGPALENFYGGLGTHGETWSGVLTQYCDGTTTGSATCTLGDAMVPYPTGKVLAGIWYDPSATSTAEETAGLTGHQLAAEAEAAASHFGRTSQASNRDAQYVIVSPTGTNPDGWADPRTGYCAYHDDTHDGTITGGGPVQGPILAFTNLPYVPDAGASCGSGSVNSPGTLDGATEAASHEYAETVTDQFPEANPPGGWANVAGNETGDLCAYVAAPAVGPAVNLTLATGTVAVQGTWSNRAIGGKGACSDGEPTFVFSPVIASVSPASAKAGATVTISGADLAGASAVTFAGTRATVRSDTTSTITVEVPAGGADGTITVVTGLGSTTSTTVFHLAPSIDSFAPVSAPRGASVTISGSGLGGVRKVTVGGRRAAVSSDSDTRIVVAVPAKATSGPIVVTTKYGTATGASPLTVT